MRARFMTCTARKPSSMAIVRARQLAGNATMLYYMTDEAQEGKNAFLEKRDPDWDQFPRLP